MARQSHPDVFHVFQQCVFGDEFSQITTPKDWMDLLHHESSPHVSYGQLAKFVTGSLFTSLAMMDVESLDRWNRFVEPMVAACHTSCGVRSGDGSMNKEGWDKKAWSQEFAVVRDIDFDFSAWMGSIMHRDFFKPSQSVSKSILDHHVFEKTKTIIQNGSPTTKSLVLMLVLSDPPAAKSYSLQDVMKDLSLSVHEIDVECIKKIDVNSFQKKHRTLLFSDQEMSHIILGWLSKIEKISLLQNVSADQQKCHQQKRM